VQRVYIANFGRQNYEWPECLTRSTIATMNREASHPFWGRGRSGGLYQLSDESHIHSGWHPSNQARWRLDCSQKYHDWD